MKRAKKFLTIGSILLTASLGLIAQEANTINTKHPRSINSREVRQEKRIDQGVKSGQLNDKEAARLEKQQDAIENREAALKADGKFTAKERTSIQRQENRTSRRIYKQKHDAQTK